SLLGRCDLQAQFLDDAARLRDLLGVRGRKASRADPQRVLETDTDVASESRRLRCDEELVASGSQHRPVIGVAKQAVGGAAHMHDVFRMGSDAAKNAEHALNEEGRLDELAVHEMRERIQMPDVVALNLETGSVLGACGQDALDVRERILEDALARTFEIGSLP